jgi:hypothetical protein
MRYDATSRNFLQYCNLDPVKNSHSHALTSLASPSVSRSCLAVFCPMTCVHKCAGFAVNHLLPLLDFRVDNSGGFRTPFVYSCRQVARQDVTHILWSLLNCLIRLTVRIPSFV